MCHFFMKPESTYSETTSNSSVSRRGRTRQYRKLANHSNVDETLFGNSSSPQLKEQHTVKRGLQRSTEERKGSGEGKESVQVITKDLIRRLVVPKRDPYGSSCVLNCNDLMRIRDSARVLTEQEKKAIAEMNQREKIEAFEASEKRKQILKELDVNRRQNEPLNELEEESKKRAEGLVQNANSLRAEREDEIKRLNELILEAKCHAIRDCQLLEKKIIEDEMKEENIRLDKMMEVDRRNAIRIQEEIEKKRHEEQLLGASKILEQIGENEQEKLLELERKDQENVQMRSYTEQLVEEEKIKLGKKKHDQQNLREELNKANDELLQRKSLRAEQERMAELKVAEFQKQKAEREAAYEKEQEDIRLEKEREVARLRGLQERARDEQAERDALRARRQQEQTEREWRKKELEAARKKKETEEMLREARSWQMDQKEHLVAVQAQRERAEFERVLRAQQELIEKDKKVQEEAKVRGLNHASEVRRQIKEKEQEKIHERRAFFEEGVKLDEEAKLRRQKLDEIKRKKLDELRTLGLPEKYLGMVERRIKKTIGVAV